MKVTSPESWDILDMQRALYLIFFMLVHTFKCVDELITFGHVLKNS